jgi:hypothetical protein
MKIKLLCMAIVLSASDCGAAVADSPKCTPSNGIHDVYSLRANANEQFAARNFKEAAHLYAVAIGRLNYRYGSDWQDDTGTKLSMADYDERQGRLRESAIVRMHVLDDRLKMCSGKK